MTDWLLKEGRYTTRIGALIAGLGNTLVDGGAPLNRLRISTRILHPLVAAWSAHWRPGGHTEQSEFGFDMFASGQYQGSPGQTIMESGLPLRIRLAEAASSDEHPLLDELRSVGLVDYYGWPLHGETNAFGYCSFATSRPGGFSESDIAKFDSIVPFIAPFVEALNMRRITVALLDTYVGRRAGERVLGGQIRRGDCERIRAAFWYSDLRDFTRLSEELPPDEMVELLNCYFDVVDSAVRPRAGEVLQFIGDAVLAVFEADKEEGSARTACESAFDAAREALAHMARINAARRAAGKVEIRFGVGLHFGEATCGNVGAEKRLSFNVVGPAVNMTARLESLSKQVGVPLVVSSTVANSIVRPVASVGTYVLKGIHDMQEVYTATELIGADPN
ncbi:adenylate cyclase [Rhizobiales bacterium GAS188]|nr:adenylate cyclase [Rhizobiales bacterium GAS188]